MMNLTEQLGEVMIGDKNCFSGRSCSTTTLLGIKNVNNLFALDEGW
jgi:hypothetical protein